MCVALYTIHVELELCVSPGRDWWVCILLYYWCGIIYSSRIVRGTVRGLLRDWWVCIQLLVHVCGIIYTDYLCYLCLQIPLCRVNGRQCVSSYTTTWCVCVCVCVLYVHTIVHTIRKSVNLMCGRGLPSGPRPASTRAKHKSLYTVCK